jgi:VIT1/CCC1 family predicted Fe2+/Mn2+ transporter
MGGVLYSATRARDNQRRREAAADERAGLSPVLSGLTTFAAALLAGVVPLAPFAVAPMPVAVVASIAISLGALFALGSWTGRLIGETWWRDGLRLLAVAGAAAVAAAAVGTVMRVD